MAFFGAKREAENLYYWVRVVSFWGVWWGKVAFRKRHGDIAFIFLMYHKNKTADGFLHPPLVTLLW
jgi:hypothetical protein